MSVRNIDVVSVPCEWSCICLSGISMLSLFLVSGYVYVCQEYRCCLCTLWMKEQRQHLYSWQTYTWPLTRNRDNIDIPDRHIHDHSQGTKKTSIFLTDIYMTTLVSGYVYVCQEYRCSLCSFWVVMYICVRNKDVDSVPCVLTDIYMTTHKVQRQHLYSWQTYTWPLTRNRDNIYIPDKHIHEWSSIYLSGI
jgi:hypothetical protein